jgi:predicted DNA-binding ribbon-helix-helix protein
MTTTSRNEKPTAATLASANKKVERVQTGIRIEKRLLKVIKALAELRDMSASNLLEGVLLHALEGKQPFNKDTLAAAAEFKRLYGLDLTAEDSHRLGES